MELGLDLCLANPGTTEMDLVRALEGAHGIRTVLGLFEGVCSGAADGYARMRGAPALTLLHTGPGLANALANLHNARRAFSPVVNLVGDHPTWHVGHDAPLTSDIEALARPMSKWVRTARSAGTLADDLADAVAAARTPPCGVATLVIPADCAWDACPPRAPRAAKVFAAARIDDRAVAAAAKALGQGATAALLLGGAALTHEGLAIAGKLAGATGCALLGDAFLARLERGHGLPPVGRLPYFPEQCAESLRAISHLVLCGARAPVSFFGYRGGKSVPLPDTLEVTGLAGAGDDVLAALAALADRLGAGAALPPAVAAPPATPRAPSGALTPATLGAVVAALQPEGAIVVDEAATSGLPYWLHAASAPPHTYLGLTGGAIGQGLPCATGAALACPERPVLSLQADGSAMYTLQALWTQARHGLDVTTIVCANRAYQILRVEHGRMFGPPLGPRAEELTSLAGPEIRWVKLAKGLGVPAARVETADALASKLERALAEPGPHLIEAVL
jgi:acetolactate synthase-1/2/3 large subunit